MKFKNLTKWAIPVSLMFYLASPGFSKNECIKTLYAVNSPFFNEATIDLDKDGHKEYLKIGDKDPTKGLTIKSKGKKYVLYENRSLDHICIQDSGKNYTLKIFMSDGEIKKITPEGFSEIEDKKLEKIALEPEMNKELDIDGDGETETIFLSYGVDSANLVINDSGKKLFCRVPDVNLYNQGKDYVFVIAENVYGKNIGFIPHDSKFNKHRYKDNYVYKEGKLVPLNEWTVQLASFSNENKAIEYVDSLLKKDYDVYIQQAMINGMHWDRVYLSSFKSKEEAGNAAKKFKKKHPDANPFVKRKEHFFNCQ